MPINTIALINVASELSERNDVQVTLKESMKGGLAAGCCAFVGGAIGGPIGIAVGGIIGSVAAATMSQGKFRSLASVIKNDLTPNQRNALAMRVYNAVKDVGIEDLTLLLPFLLQNQNLQMAVMNAVVSFVTNDLRMSVANQGQFLSNS